MENKMSVDLDKHVLKTGTLTVGIVCKDGIVLAADNRLSYGGGGGVSYIADTANKVVSINDRCLVTTAGNGSDINNTVKLLRAEVKLKELRSRTETSIKQIASLTSNVLYQNIRQPSMIPSIVHFLIAGYDEEGFHLYGASPDGFLKNVETYEATGVPFESLAIFDMEYKKNLTLEEGIKLAKKVFTATKGRQPGVGDGWDIYTIKKDKIEKVSSQKVVDELKDKE